ncbi:MAG: quinolinate synthase NadA [Pseudomonadota bacterium]
MDLYSGFTDEQLKLKINEIKKRLENRLVILGHHYQRQDIIDLSDILGDSFELAKKAALLAEVEYIVFCGVHFMAEAADILSSSKQKVILPNLSAGCPMAEMANEPDVLYAWNYLGKIFNMDSFIPITYMNSTAAIKAFCGKHNGLVCTSSNAEKAFRFALNQNKKIFFFPDEHLGTNTALSLGIDDEYIFVWDPKISESEIDIEHLNKSQIITWKGFCHVHTWFTAEHIQNIRVNYPKAKIVVHPECPKDIVLKADSNGSTSHIINYVQKLPVRAEVAIGTEINLVSRLAALHKDKKVIPLARSLCPNMYRINLQNLLYSLENLGEVNVIVVDEEVKKYAKIALDRMLEL